MRAQLLLGSVYVRDALLDPDPMASDGYRRQLQETYVQAVNALDQYTPVDDSAMVRERVRRYRDAGINNLRLDPMGDTTSERLDTLTRALEIVRQECDGRRNAAAG